LLFRKVASIIKFCTRAVLIGTIGRLASTSNGSSSTHSPGTAIPAPGAPIAGPGLNIIAPNPRFPSFPSFPLPIVQAKWDGQLINSNAADDESGSGDGDVTKVEKLKQLVNVVNVLGKLFSPFLAVATAVAIRYEWLSALVTERQGILMLTVCTTFCTNTIAAKYSNN
jgi:hypothetical protein